MRWMLVVGPLISAAMLGAADAATPNVAEGVFAGAPRSLKTQQLDRLEFRIRFDPDRIEYLEQVKGRLAEDPAAEDVKKNLESLLLRQARLEKSPIALFLSKASYRASEPIDAYFVVKNVSSESVGLDMRLDLWLGNRTTNECGVRLERVLESGTQNIVEIREHAWECGGPPRITLPVGGYYCARADLRRLGATEPGTYRVHWNYSALLSQEVEFVIEPGGDAREEEIDHQEFRFARIVGGRADRKFSDQSKRREPEQTPMFREPQLARLFPGPFAAGLSVGSSGNLYPDVRDLPSEDALVTASLTVQQSSEDKLPPTLLLTLTPKQNNAGLFLRDDLHLCLMAVAHPESKSVPRVAQEQAKELRRAHDGYSLADPHQPLQIRIELSEDWQDQLGVSGVSQLRVIISSEEIESQGRWPGIQRLVREQHREGQRPLARAAMYARG